MPIYEYECKKCGDIIEAIQGFNDNPLKKHNDCGGKLKKVISLSSFHLKGSGWYDTEYGKKKIKRGTQSAQKDNKSDKKESDTKDPSDAARTSESIKDDTNEAKNKSKK